MSNDRRAALSAAMSASGDSTSPSASGGSTSNSGGGSAPSTPAASAPSASGALATPPPDKAPTSPAGASRLRAPSGQFTKDGAGGEGVPKPGDASVATPATPGTEEGTPAEAPEAPNSTEDAPHAATQEKGKEPPPTLKGAVREEWASIPKVAQEELTRQANMLGRLGRVAGEARKALTGWQQVVEPFQKLMGNANPQQVAAGLFQTAAALATGTPDQKLAIVESLAANNKIDVTPIVRRQLASMPPEAQAATLAAFIQENKISPDLVADFLEGKRQAPQAGATPPPQQSPAQVPHDPRLDALLDGVQRSRQAKAQQEMAAMAREVQKFSKEAEFLEYRFPDTEDSPRGPDGEPLTIREHMADLVETAEKQGRKPNLKKIYELACKENPTVLKIMQQREAKARAQAANTSAQRAQAAASSVRSEPVAAQSAKPGDRRAMLAAEMAAQRGR